MDSTMFQLRSFVHQRLYAAAEEIFGEVEKVITLALNKAEVHRHKEEAESPPPHQLDLKGKKSGLGLILNVCECLIVYKRYTTIFSSAVVAKFQVLFKCSLTLNANVPNT